MMVVVLYVMMIMYLMIITVLFTLICATGSDDANEETYVKSSDDGYSDGDKYVSNDD